MWHYEQNPNETQGSKSVSKSLDILKNADWKKGAK